MPSEPEGKEVPAEGNDDAVLKPDKYMVTQRTHKGLPSERVIKNAFVLLPEKDPAALQALRAYASVCRSPVKQKEIIEWVKRIEREIVPQWQKGEHLGSMGRINAGIDKLV